MKTTPEINGKSLHAIGRNLGSILSEADRSRTRIMTFKARNEDTSSWESHVYYTGLASEINRMINEAAAHIRSFGCFKKIRLIDQIVPASQINGGRLQLSGNDRLALHEVVDYDPFRGKTYTLRIYYYLRQ